MNLKNMVEEVRMHFPAIGRTKIVFDINKVLREFVTQSRALYSVYEMTFLADGIERNMSELTTTYTVPDATYEILSVDELLRDVYELRDTTLIIHSGDPSIDELTLRYTQYPPVLATDGESPALDELFHPAIVSGVLARYYRAQGNLPGYQLYFGEYKEYLADAKKYSNTQRYRNTGAFSGESMGAIVAYGTQILADGENTVPMNKTFSNTLYRIMLNGNGVEVQEYDPNGNNDQRTTTSFKVLSVGPATDFEYFVIGS